MTKSLLLAVAALGLTLSAQADSIRHGSLEIEHVYAQATKPGQPNGVVHIKEIENKGAADQLVGARSSASKRVELHTMSMDGGMMKMREVAQIDLPAGGKISLAPGNPPGYHLMLMGLKDTLTEGSTIKVTLVFKNAGEKEITAKVSTGGKHHADKHHGGGDKHHSGSKH
ncbi:MAG: hypothetical protein RL617_206 [Pseudomonadota bacterium]